MNHGVLYDSQGNPEVRVDGQYVCLCGQGCGTIGALYAHISEVGMVRESRPATAEGRRSELDALLDRLLDAERQVAIHQRAASGIRRQIHDRFAELEQEGQQ